MTSWNVGGSCSAAPCSAAADACSVLIAVFSLVSEGFLDPFFASPMGMALLAIALGMQAAGIVAVRRMLAVEVG